MPRKLKPEGCFGPSESESRLAPLLSRQQEAATCALNPKSLPQELEGLSREDVQRYLPAFLSSLHLEAFLHGNIRQQDAVTLGRAVRAALQAGAAAAGSGSSDTGVGEESVAEGPLAADARPVDRCVQLPRPCGLLHRRVHWRARSTPAK